MVVIEERRLKKGSNMSAEHLSEKRASGVVVAAGICLLISFLAALVPLIGWLFASPFALVAFILGIVACCQARAADGIMAIIGSLVVVPMGAIAGWIAVAILGAGASQLSKPAPPPPAPIVLKEEKSGNSASEFADSLKRAEGGDAESQYQVGLCYYVGDGVPQDVVKASEWFKLSAEQGHAKAIVALRMYENKKP